MIQSMFKKHSNRKVLLVIKLLVIISLLSCKKKEKNIDFIEDQNLNFNLGNAVKYISRAGKKDPAKFKEDLEKAIWYLNRELAKQK